MRKVGPRHHPGAWRWIVLVAALAGVSLQAGAQGDADQAATTLHRAMAAALREEALVGAVWATVTPGGVATGAAGLADADAQRPLSAESKVQTGSVAKTLIAIGVLRLVSEGRLALDSPVTSVVPELQFENPWAPTHPVLLRHLLDHTSGLDDARLWQVFSLNARADAPLSESVPPGPWMRIRTRPGSRFSYSNIGYTVLGMVIEKVTGERYEAHLERQLLRPLGMRDSSLRFVTQKGGHADAQLAMGHFENGVSQAAVAQHLRPAGQFTTTASDMAILARFLMGDGTVGGQPFIAPGLLRAMGRPTTTEARLAGLEAGYGLGLSGRDRHGVIALCHDGNTVGFRANLCLFPDQQKAFFVAMNADVETADYERFDALLTRDLGIAGVPAAAPATPPERIEAWQGIYVLAPGRIDSLAYLDRVLNFATVRWDGRELHLNPFQGKARALLPVGGGLFRAHDRVRASHVLLVSGAGQRVISTGLRSYEQVGQWRLVPLWASLLAGVAGLLYVLLAGLFGALRRRLKAADPLFVPLLGSLALCLPVPLFLGQSFLRIGDLTAASATLALATGMLPLAMCFGIWQSLAPRRTPRRAAPIDRLAMLFVLQWSVVLAFWGLLPLRLWI